MTSRHSPEIMDALGGLGEAVVRELVGRSRQESRSSYVLRGMLRHARAATAMIYRIFYLEFARRAAQLPLREKKLRPPPPPPAPAPTRRRKSRRQGEPRSSDEKITGCRNKKNNEWHLSSGRHRQKVNTQKLTLLILEITLFLSWPLPPLVGGRPAPPPTSADPAPWRTGPPRQGRGPGGHGRGSARWRWRSSSFTW